jgi:hypothetical protein
MSVVSGSFSASIIRTISRLQHEKKQKIKLVFDIVTLLLNYFSKE